MGKQELVRANFDGKQGHIEKVPLNEVVSALVETRIPRLSKEKILGKKPVKNLKEAQYLQAINESVQVDMDKQLRKRKTEKQLVNQDEALDNFLMTLGSEKTKKQYKKFIYDFINWYNNRNRESFLCAERSDSITYLQECKRYGERNHYSKNWFVNKFRALSSLWSWLELTYPEANFINVFRNHKISYNEYDKNGELTVKDIILITEKEIKIILSELSKHKNNGKILSLAVKVMIETGMRVGGLKPMKILWDNENKVFRFRTISKGNLNYRGIISGGLVNEIKQAGLKLEKPFMILEVNTLKNNIRIIKRKYDMKFSAGCHAFRHYSAVSLYKKSKKNIIKVQRFLNHQNINTTGIYLNYLHQELE